MFLDSILGTKKLVRKLKEENEDKDEKIFKLEIYIKSLENKLCSRENLPRKLGPLPSAIKGNITEMNPPVKVPLKKKVYFNEPKPSDNFFEISC